MSPGGWSTVLRNAFLAVVLLGGGQWAGANAAVPDASALLNAGEQLLQKNDVKGAEAQFRQAVQQAPNNPRAHVQLARLYLKQSNLHAAEAEVVLVKQKRLLVDKSDYSNVELSDELDATLSEILFRQGETARLLREVPAGNRAPQLESTVRTYRGLAELGLGSRANAKTMLEDAERLDPGSIPAKIAMARLLFAAGDAKAAERKIDDVLAIAPRDSNALDMKGAIVRAAGKTDDALGYFNSALKEDPRNSGALLNRARLYIAKGDLDRATEDVRLLQQTDTTRWMSIYLHASIAVRQRDYKTADEALAKFRPAMDRMPESYLLAGIVKYQLNQFSQADEYLTRYVAREKRRAEAYQYLGAVALKQGNPKRAIEMLDQALKLAPKNEDSLRLLSEAKKASNG
jgi:Tfp pilus assembly protein PilF